MYIASVVACVAGAVSFNLRIRSAAAHCTTSLKVTSFGAHVTGVGCDEAQPNLALRTTAVSIGTMGLGEAAHLPRFSVITRCRSSKLAGPHRALYVLGAIMHGAMWERGAQTHPPPQQKRQKTAWESGHTNRSRHEGPLVNVSLCVVLIVLRKGHVSPCYFWCTNRDLTLSKPIRISG